VPLRRAGRPGLLGSIGPDDVIAGTAAMTSRLRGSEHPAADNTAPQQVEEQEQVGESAFRSALASAPDLVSQLAELAQLHDSGVITEEEFRSAKALLLTR
jgi:hypothetical protein